MPTDERHAKPVLIDGATGYLGSHLACRLVKQGPVRALVHSRAASEDVELLRSNGVEVYSGDFCAGAAQTKASSGEIASAFKGCGTAIHLIGSIAPKKGQSLADLHEGQTRDFVQYCKQTGVDRIVMVTALGTAPGARSAYHSTKWQAEEIVRSCGIASVILRPSLLVGRQVGNRDSKLVKRLRTMIESRNMVPVIEGGRNKLQPLFIGDLVEAMVRIVKMSEPEFAAIAGRALELGGPQPVSMKEIVTALMKSIGSEKPIVSLPANLAFFLASLCQLMQDVPLVSKDQVTMSLADNVCSENHLATVLGVHPVSLQEALASYSARSGSQAVVSR